MRALIILTLLKQNIDQFACKFICNCDPLLYFQVFNRKLKEFILLKTVFFVFLFSLATTACLDDSNKNDEIMRESFMISPFQLPCVAVDQQLCLLIISSDSNTEELFYDSIENFEYSWGFTYQITVSKENSEASEVDSANIKYTLITVDSKSEDPQYTEYEIQNVELLANTITKTDGSYFFLGYPFSCDDISICENLLSMNNSAGIVSITFIYSGNGEINLKNWI